MRIGRSAGLSVTVSPHRAGRLGLEFCVPRPRTRREAQARRTQLPTVFKHRLGPMSCLRTAARRRSPSIFSGKPIGQCDRAQLAGQQIRSEVVHARKCNSSSVALGATCGAADAEEADTGKRDSGEEAPKTRPWPWGPSQVASAVRGSRAIHHIMRAVPLHCPARARYPLACSHTPIPASRSLRRSCSCLPSGMDLPKMIVRNRILKVAMMLKINRFFSDRRRVQTVIKCVCDGRSIPAYYKVNGELRANQ